MRFIKTYIFLLVVMVCSLIHAQPLIDRTNLPLSPSEVRAIDASADLLQIVTSTLYSIPVFIYWCSHNDTTSYHRTALIYTGLAGADSKGDFVPYEGNGSTDYRIGAYGEYLAQHGGTLSGRIQYSQGEHRNIGYSAMRLPELYFPYISTDSCGGDFKYDTYYIEGNYAFSLSKWLLGVKSSFYGEQAYRLTDPRALNNTMWLRFNTGFARDMEGHLFMLDVGYGRNKQHMQLRYWRPGQQDRFFVCYGFGLYDTRQSAVSFGKSRMYYINEYNSCFQYLSPKSKPLQLHFSMKYSFGHMTTEESDIYNLYESRSHHFVPMLNVTYNPRGNWRFDLMTEADILHRKGYENIIEEYLIDKGNNIYDFRTIDTRQNYIRNTSDATVALRTTKRINHLEVHVQGGVSVNNYEERYRSNGYCVKVASFIPHVRLGTEWNGKNDDMTIGITYSKHEVGNHKYDIQMQNQQIAHLDFQHAFAPYAYETANFQNVVADITWTHRLKNLDYGINGKLCITEGNRLDDVTYEGIPGFLSSAPCISTVPDKHNERWAKITAFVKF